MKSSSTHHKEPFFKEQSRAVRASWPSPASVCEIGGGRQPQHGGGGRAPQPCSPP